METSLGDGLTQSLRCGLRQGVPVAGFPEGSLFHGTEISERVHVSWGTFALVEATRALMRASLEDPLNQKFVLLSEAGIPLYPPDLFYVQLMSEDKSRINSCVDTGVSMQAVQPLTYPAALSVLQHSSGSECDGACVRSAAALTRVRTYRICSSMRLSWLLSCAQCCSVLQLCGP